MNLASSDQMPLGIAGKALCGYCDRPLVAVVTGRVHHWLCIVCAPKLANVGTVEEWAKFHREARPQKRARQTDGQTSEEGKSSVRGVGRSRGRGLAGGHGRLRVREELGRSGRMTGYPDQHLGGRE